LPRPGRDIPRFDHASPRVYRRLRDEFAQLPTSLAQARSCLSPGDPPVGWSSPPHVMRWQDDCRRGWRHFRRTEPRVVPYT
jgi:hypothetical protein